MLDARRRVCVCICVHSASGAAAAQAAAPVGKSILLSALPRIYHSRPQVTRYRPYYRNNAYMR